METFRLKNIVILILLLLNLCLLILLGSSFWQSQRTVAETAEQLTALYAANQLELNSRLDLQQQPLGPLSLTRQSETEQAIAAALLGGVSSSSSQGGGIYSYQGPNGTLQFRSGGSFDGSGLTLAVDDINAFAAQFCQQFGYEDMQIQVRSRSGSVTAIQRVADVPIFGCEVTLLFDRGVLTAVTGAHVGLEDAVPEPSDRMNCVTALVRFLDCRSSSGIVCSQVTDIQCVYELQSGPQLRLLPVWRVETDTYAYFVDCASGEVTRH